MLVRYHTCVVRISCLISDPRVSFPYCVPSTITEADEKVLLHICLEGQFSTQKNAPLTRLVFLELLLKRQNNNFLFNGAMFHSNENH